MRKTRAFLFLIGFGVLCSILGSQPQVAAQNATPNISGFDTAIDKNAQQMIESGRHIFRYDTFGSEAFWGGALQLHRAIAGAKNGGVATE
jgi:hypothetical protein